MRARYGGYRGFNMTPIWVLLAANFMVFIASLIAEDRIFDLLGLHPISPEWPLDPGFFEQPWTIVTNMFVHAGLWHILGNMIMLYFFGSYLLGLLGEKRFLFIYFVGGLVGNILLLALAPLFPFSVAVGASGALFAIMGTMAVMRPKLKVLIWFLIPVDLWIVALFGALIIATQMTTPTGIAWQAHIGGLVFGLVAGLYFRKKERGRFWG